MPNYQAEARQAAQRHGLDPNIFLRQINQESGFNPNARSRYAVGIAQFTPDTARGLGINPLNPRQSLDGAARLMASYVRKFGSYHDALVAYNAGPARVGKPLYAETANYVKTILGHGGGAGASIPASSGSGPTSTTVQRGTFDQAGFQQAQKRFLLGQLLSRTGRQEGNPLFASGLLTTQPPDASSFKGTKNVRVSIPGSSSSSSSSIPGLGGKGGSFNVAAGAERPGAFLQPTIKSFLRTVSGAARIPITVTTGTNHNRLTVDGNVSDHWAGNAADIGVPVDSAKGDRIAAAALMSLGVPRAQAQTDARRGGLYTITRHGVRYQVIWKTYQGGNHHNHVHIGAAPQ